MKIYPIIVYPAFYKYIRLFGKKVSKRCNWWALGCENRMTKHIDYTLYPSWKRSGKSAANKILIEVSLYIGLKGSYKCEEGSV